MDAHCDTLTKIMEFKEEFYENTGHVDLKRLKAKGDAVQFFAAFIDPAYCQAYAMKRAVQIIDRFYEDTAKFPEDIAVCLKHEDIVNALSAKKVAAILSIEGGDALQGDISALRIFYRLGVRAIGLTWNHRNEIADGVGDEQSGGGLTPFGRKVIENMNALGMIVDLSHIAEKGFWDVMELTKAPVIASHSNARKICSHKRNLWDDQILALKKNGGVMGINLYTEFLSDSQTAGLRDIIKHIEYIAALAGTDCIGIGADFDGIETTPDGIDGIQHMDKVFNELAKLNYSQETIEKLAGGNFLRVIKEVLR